MRVPQYFNMYLFMCVQIHTYRYISLCGPILSLLYTCIDTSFLTHIYTPIYRNHLQVRGSVTQQPQYLIIHVLICIYSYIHINISLCIYHQFHDYISIQTYRYQHMLTKKTFVGKSVYDRMRQPRQPPQYLTIYIFKCINTYIHIDISLLLSLFSLCKYSGIPLLTYICTYICGYAYRKEECVRHGGHDSRLYI